MKAQSATELALWLQQNEPQIFAKLTEEVAKRSGGKLGDFSDILSGIGTAAKNVGSFLASPDGIKTLSAVGSVYLQSRAQTAALNTQVKLAQAGYSPAPIRNVIDGTTGQVTTQIITPQGGAQPFTPQNASYYQSTANMKLYLPWIIGGGLALLLFGFAFSRR